jgi:hypothetical protein
MRECKSFSFLSSILLVIYMFYALAPFLRLHSSTGIAPRFRLRERSCLHDMLYVEPRRDHFLERP